MVFHTDAEAAETIVPLLQHDGFEIDAAVFPAAIALILSTRLLAPNLHWCRASVLKHGDRARRAPPDDKHHS